MTNLFTGVDPHYMEGVHKHPLTFEKQYVYMFIYFENLEEDKKYLIVHP